MVSKKLLRRLLENLDDDKLSQLLDNFDLEDSHDHYHANLPNKACFDLDDMGNMTKMLEDKYGDAFHGEYDEAGMFSAAYGPQLMASPNRDELFIINPTNPETFFTNLVHLLKATGLFKAEGGYVMMQPDPHFDIKLRICLALSCNTKNRFGKHDEITLTCNTHKRRFYAGEKVPNVPLLTRFNEVWGDYSQGLYHPIFENITSWHMKFVVNHPWTKEDMDYIRTEVVPNPNYEKPYKAIKRNKYNYNGVSIYYKRNAPKYFYDEKRFSMELLYNPKYGGVCGWISNSITVCCQARGIPATTIGQPGHCAMMWCKPTDATGTSWNWKRGYSNGNLSRSTFKYGEWSKLTSNASWPLVAMDETFKKKNYFFFATTFKTMFDELMAQHSADREKVQEAVGHLMSAITYAPSYLPYWIALAGVKDLESEWVLKNGGELSESETLTEAFQQMTSALRAEKGDYANEFLDLELALLEDKFFAEEYQ